MLNNNPAFLKKKKRGFAGEIASLFFDTIYDLLQ
jgi:hypothetical protein